jgi:hypothetical protein
LVLAHRHPLELLGKCLLLLEVGLRQRGLLLVQPHQQQLAILLSLVAAVLAVFLLLRLPLPEAAQEGCALGRYQFLAALPTPLRSVLAVLLAPNLVSRAPAEPIQYSVQ